MSETINQRVARCRRLADLTQTEAAEKLGMKCSTYSQMERKGRISAQMVLDLAAIFNVHPNVIFYGENPITTIPSEPKPDIGNGTGTLEQPINEPIFPASPNFILSKQEENLITMIRNVSKADRDEIKDFVFNKYQNRKNKKK